jgi:hypothetical protein
MRHLSGSKKIVAVASAIFLVATRIELIQNNGNENENENENEKSQWQCELE